MVDRSSLQPKPCSAARTMLHALEYAMFMEAAAARREDYGGLPPAYTFVSTAEPFYAETLAYIDRLKQAGVEASLDVYPGLFHAFDMLLPFLKVSKKAAAAFEKRFEYAARHCFAEQTSD